MAKESGDCASGKRSAKPEPTKATVKGGRFGALSNQPLFFTISVVSAMAVFYYHRAYVFLPSVIRTKCPVAEVVNHSAYAVEPAMFWGTYRANLYIGMGSRSSVTPLFGAMWFWQSADGGIGLPKIRHWCNQDDRLAKYAWIEHDGKYYGIQDIQDGSLNIKATMVKRPTAEHPGDWAWRIDTRVENEAESSRPYTFIFYLVHVEWNSLRLAESSPKSYVIEGDSKIIGKFRFHILSDKEAMHSSDVQLQGVDPSIVEETLLKHVRVFSSDSSDLKLIGLSKSNLKNDGNLIAVQLTTVGSCRFELVFEALEKRQKTSLLVGEEFDSLLSKRRDVFAQNFEKTFGLKGKQYADVFLDMGKYALGNMLGSISYFHGMAIVQSEYNVEPVLYGPLELFSTIPSRPFFPRGFLWDEGFHQLLLHFWDRKLSFEILGHWLDLMNVEGWIPREVILGAEALRKVPWEFVTQRNNVANPPVFFYLLNSLLKTDALHSVDKTFLNRIYPRLKLWYLWLNKTQAGAHPGTFRWQGRNGTTELELNPKTLPSGMDDYPRASHPTPEEYHLDLYCWMAVSTDCMARLAEVVNDQTSVRQFKEFRDFLADPELLHRLHWSDRKKRFCDYGLHTKMVSLEEVTIRTLTPQEQQQQQREKLTEVRRVVKGKPTTRLVSDVFGYVSLFPMFLRLLKADSPELRHLLDQLTDPELLWTPYGLRSLAKVSTGYGKRNTEHDPPYWRGSIWMNMNYLALSSLHYYSEQGGPNRDKAFKVYSELRNAVIGNVVRQYVKTGYLWEHYNDETGDGEGSHPFTGWSSLVLLMMAEMYE